MSRPASAPIHSRFPAIAAAIVAALGFSGCGSQTSTSTAPSPLLRCGVTLGVSDATLPAAGGTGRVTVTTARECSWTARSEVSWLSITGASNGQGDGAVDYRATANPDPVARGGALVLNDTRAEMTQAAGECLFSLRETAASFPQSGGAGAVTLQASSPLCAWTASADAEWVRITPPTSGQGSATVAFQVLASTDPPRTSTMSVAGQRFSITQAEGCAYVIAPDAQSIGAAGGSGVVTVSTTAGCPWTAGSNVDWITVTQGDTGVGPGNVAFSVSPTSGPTRTGTLLVAGRTFTVTQTQGCSFEVAPLTHTVEPAGGIRSLAVSAGNGCQWTAAGHVPWISITAGTSGSGAGTVSFAVAASTGPARSGTLTVAGQTVTVMQSQGCTYAIAPESQTVGVSGGSGEVTVTAPGGCAWTATSTVEWISITEGANGTGNGTVRFTVAATSGPARTGILTVAGRTFTVAQGQGCSVTLSPDRTTSSSAGGPGTFSVQAAVGCGWTASSTVPWISIASGQTGTGSGTVTLSIAANSGAPRSGTVTVSGQTFTVDQQGVCSYALSRSSQNVQASGGTGTVSVTAAGGCAWTASSREPWMVVTSGASGSGNGNVTFSVAPNQGPARSGTLTIAGLTFTVEQEGACSYGINPLQHAADSAGGSVTVNVTASGVACPWTATSSAQWISVTEGASGAGNGTVRLTIAANTGPARIGAVTIAGQTFTVQQASGCSYVLSPSSRGASPNGATNSFTVTTAAGCEWTAVSQAPWLTIIEGAKGTGPGSVQYGVAPNDGAESRTGTITVQDQVFTVTQNSGESP